MRTPDQHGRWALRWRYLVAISAEPESSSAVMRCTAAMTVHREVPDRQGGGVAGVHQVDVPARPGVTIGVGRSDDRLRSARRACTRRPRSRVTLAVVRIPEQRATPALPPILGCMDMRRFEPRIRRSTATSHPRSALSAHVVCVLVAAQAEVAGVAQLAVVGSLGEPTSQTSSG